MPDARSPAAAHPQDFLPLSAAGAGREGSWRREKERGRRGGRGGQGEGAGRGARAARGGGARGGGGATSPPQPRPPRLRAHASQTQLPRPLWLPPPPLCALLSPCPAPCRGSASLWRVRRTFRLLQPAEAGWGRGPGAERLNQ